MAPLRSLRTKLGLRKHRPKPAANNSPQKLTAAQILKNELYDKAIRESADFVMDQVEHALIFDSIDDIFQYSVDSAPKDGLVLEFGVFKGKSINFMARRLMEVGDTRPIYGFDAFLGLEENWAGTDHKAQKQFNLDGVAPEVEANVTIVNGWIEDTLPAFLEKNPGKIAYLHIDTDTYTPCKTILSLCKDRLAPGTVVLFDDLLCYPGWRFGEFKALNETFSTDQYTWRAFAGWRGLLVLN